MHLSVYVYVCIHVCLCSPKCVPALLVPVHAYECARVRECAYVYVSVSVSVCVHVCGVWGVVHVCVPVCMYCCIRTSGQLRLHG